MAVLSYGLASFVRLTVLAITSKDGRFGALAVSAAARGPRKELTRLDQQPNRRPLKRVAYRPREVAEMVGMSESGVRNLIKRGTLRAVQLDGRWLIPAAVIEDKLGVSLDARAASDAASIRPMTGQPPPGGDLDVA
jgi:excisionase family DNA binding protein